jgi:hypothetical protein
MDVPTLVTGTGLGNLDVFRCMGEDDEPDAIIISALFDVFADSSVSEVILAILFVCGWNHVFMCFRGN